MEVSTYYHMRIDGYPDGHIYREESTAREIMAVTRRGDVEIVRIESDGKGFRRETTVASASRGH